MREPRRNGGVRWGALGTLLVYEMRMLMRDKRTVLIAIVAPLVLFPLAILGMRGVDRVEERRLESATYRYAVVGDRSEWASQVVRRALALGPEEPGGEGPGRRTGASATAPAFVEEDVGGLELAGWAAEDTDSILRHLQIHVLVRGLSPERYNRLAEPDSGDAALIPIVVTEYRGTDDFSRRAADRLRSRLVRYREARREEAYRRYELPVPAERIFEVEAINVATAAKEGGALLGTVLTPVLLLLMLSGGSIVAADAISGEKERGTLETLLTTSARRSEIVGAKILGIVVVGLTVGVVNLLNLLAYVVLGLVDLPEGLAVELSGLDLVLMLGLIVPLTVLVAAALLLPSAYAKSYREYQIYFFPLFLVLLVPSLAGLLPGIELRSAAAFVPISGVGLAIRELMIGQRDWLFLGVAFTSTGGAAWALAKLAERTLSTERLIVGNVRDEADLTRGSALFGRHVLGWFMGMWAAFFIVNLWFGQTLGLRGQVVVNIGVIFLGASVLMLRRYRLPVREALALRRPRPSAWLAVLLGAPSALVVAMGLSALANTYVFPVPEEVIEAFGEALLGPDLPLWQLLLFAALIPGILEEVAFRGLLLHGLRQWMRPVPLVLSVGVVFGLFHVSLFRIVPTAYLGVLLAAVVVLTRSLYPAMVWHVMNNALAILSGELGWVEDDGALPRWVYGLAALGLACSFLLMWRARTPAADAGGHADPSPPGGV